MTTKMGADEKKITFNDRELRKFSFQKIAFCLWHDTYIFVWLYYDDISIYLESVSHSRNAVMGRISIQIYIHLCMETILYNRKLCVFHKVRTFVVILCMIFRLVGNGCDTIEFEILFLAFSIKNCLVTQISSHGLMVIAILKQWQYLYLWIILHIT